MVTKCHNFRAIIIDRRDETMPITITPAEKQDVTKIVCPHCGLRLRDVALAKGSKTDGLLFVCSRCKNRWNLKSE